MPSIRKRQSGYRVEVYVRGQRDSATFDTKSEELQWGLDCEEELKTGKHESALFCALGQAFDRYIKEVSVNKKGYRREKVRLNLLSGCSFSSVKLTELQQQDFIKWRNDRLRQVSPSSVNREMNLISNVLTYCRDEWHWMTDNPMKGVKRPSKEEARDRRISQPEINQICISCGYAEDLPVTTQQQRLAVAFLFAIETAMRLKEICKLRTDRVIGHVAILPETKTTPRKVPLSSRAIELLGKLEPIDDFYFGGNSESYSALFRKVRQRTPIKDLTFQDSRHEAITRLAKKLDVLDLERMVGHKDLKMLLVYYNLSAEDLADKLD